MGGKTTRTKVPKSLLVPKKNITKIDPELRKRSMTNIRINTVSYTHLTLPTKRIV